jgi:hypothetical protein
MKSSFKIIFLSIGILFLSLSVSYATNETDPLSSDVSYQIQPSSINDLIYLLIVKGPEKLFYPTFEFEAGNSLKVISASHEYGELTGTWQEVDFALFSYFQAQVEESETVTTTTTTAAPATTNLMSDRFETTETTKFLIDLWGISFASLPPPFASVGMLVGAGAYLGANVVFIGFASVPIPGEEPEFGSISPGEGKQESTLTDVTITGVNTTFQDDGVDNIGFSPPEGVTVSNISTISNTKIEFDLTIADNAPIEVKSVIVTYDNSSIIISGINVFEILPK